MTGNRTPRKNAPALEMLPPGRLIPHARNAREHSEAQIAQVASSIREFGFQAPVVIDADNGILAGHARVRAALLLGLEEVPCVRAEHLSERERRLYMIADNRLAELSTWNREVLALELGDLAESGESIDIVGFTESDLDAMLGELDEDGHGANESNGDGSAAIEPYSTQVQIGPYRIPIERDRFERWEESVRAAVGFERDRILAEIVKRLAI